MALVDLPYLWTYRRRGVTLAYYLRDGRTTRIRDAAGNALAPGDAGFLAAYTAIHAAAGPAKPPRPSGPSAGSLAALIDAYRGSPEYGSSFHGLRKALTAGLVEAGATDAEAEAIVYHATAGMTRHYRAGADRRRLARSGMAKLAGKDEG